MLNLSLIIPSVQVSTSSVYEYVSIDMDSGRVHIIKVMAT